MIRFPMRMYSNGKYVETEYISLYAEDMGDLSITHQERPLYEGEREIAIHVDFDVSNITIIDAYGNDHKIKVSGHEF